MDVKVELHGVRGPVPSGHLPARLDLQIAERSTAGDLLSALADRCGGAFRQALDSPDERLQRHIRMFAEGEPLTHRRQALARPGAEAGAITIVLLSPMSGG